MAKGKTVAVRARSQDVDLLLSLVALVARLVLIYLYIYLDPAQLSQNMFFSLTFLFGHTCVHVCARV